MTRRSDAIERLEKYLTRISALKYDPVQHNCGTFVLGALEVMTTDSVEMILARVGVDVPVSKLGVSRVLAECGGVRGLATRCFGGPGSAAVLCARRGDVAVLDGDDGECLGVVEVGGVICLAPEGLRRFPLSNAKGYWPL